VVQVVEEAETADVELAMETTALVLDPRQLWTSGPQERMVEVVVSTMVEVAATNPRPAKATRRIEVRIFAEM
jgi:hypothetical protein